MLRARFLLVVGILGAAAGACSTANDAVVAPMAPGATASQATSTTTTRATTTTTAVARTTATTTSTASTTTQEPRTEVLSDPASVGHPWGTAVQGLLTFRGNPTRTWHGTGPLPSAPKILWRYPSKAMCGSSSEYGDTRTWCGTGWVGQPAVFERGGRTWVVFGAYDYKVHFVDAATGQDILPPFPTGDLAKGTVTVDPDGFPLVYAGSRDNKLRVLAIDRPQATELWALNAHDPRLQPHLWNDDWDASPLVLRDHLITGGENSRFHAVKLNRSYGADGKVQVAPQLVFSVPSWDEDLLRSIPDRRVSVEGSVAVFGDTAYFSNSGGLLQGWDISGLRTGQAPGNPTRTFRFWTGDDTDAAVVVDGDGSLYVGQEWDRHNARGQQVGQLLKIDPRRPDQPVVWAIHQAQGEKSGTWAAAALYEDLVIWTTYPGQVFGVDRATGAIRWTVKLPFALVSSPNVVDGMLLQADSQGVIHAFALGDGSTAPVERWTVRLPANIESTPAVWRGRLYVGTRDGYFYAVG